MKKKKKKILTWRKVIKSSVCSFCRFRMSIKKTQYCQNNPKNSYTEKKAKHKPSGYAWCSICSFDDTKNKHYFYRERIVLKSYVKI